MVEEIKAGNDRENKENVVTTVDEKKKKSADLICIGMDEKVDQGALQKNFDRFRKVKRDEIKYRNFVAKNTSVNRKDPVFN